MVASLSGGAPASAAGVISSIDLSRPFQTRSAWHFTAVQGRDVRNSYGEAGDTFPGPICLCISKDRGRSCQPGLRTELWDAALNDSDSGPHFLEKVEIVRPRSGRALLLVRAANLPSGNGDYGVATQVLAYDQSRDTFITIYRNRTPHNNNQETRYITGGPLKGAMISVEPTEDAPYGFWVTVDRLTPALTYRQALRYRSATHYGDGNPLAVIDSEMPNIEQRLGLWRAGAPLPLPKGRCLKPHLIRMELWCN